MVRLHIPVVTNDGVDFRLNGVRCPMSAGSTWYLRLSDPHSVANRGSSDRVHLVIDRGGRRLGRGPVRGGPPVPGRLKPYLTGWLSTCNPLALYGKEPWIGGFAPF